MLSASVARSIRSRGSAHSSQARRGPHPPQRHGTLNGYRPMFLEDYGLIGDLQTAALVGRNGAVDWLCLPRFDSASCLSALLGDERHGRWLLAPAGEVHKTTRRYRPGTLVLETEFETADGTVRVIDFMPVRRGGPPRLMRVVEGTRGRVPMRMELSLRPDYGSIKPW